MKTSNTSERLKQLIRERGLRQVEILEMCKPYCEMLNCKLGKSDLSQFISGKVEPGQLKLTVLSLALDVTETWLMGYDVSDERKDSTLSSRMKMLVKNIARLDEGDFCRIEERVETMLESDKYKSDASVR